MTFLYSQPGSLLQIRILLRYTRTKILSFLRKIMLIQFVETSWSVGKFKRDNLVFKITVSSLKNNFPFISFPNPHLMVSISSIQLTKTLSLTSISQTILYQRQKIFIFHSQVILISIIDIEMEVSILLSIQKQNYTCYKFSRSNKPSFQIGFDISLQYF